jgi:simple sugar transport system ATP-binding protein
MSVPELELRGIFKAFGATVANRHVDLEVERGRIHAVVGENGAGKSTLLQIAAGLVQADAGEIRIRGEVLSRPTPARAIARGVGLVAQHFLLIPPFTVAENVVLGAEPHLGARLDRARAEAEVAALAARFGLAIDPARPVETLSVGEQQRVEILKVLYRKAELLILDEPTAVLAPVEVDELFTVLRSLAAQGRTVVFVTHKLREVMAVSDRVTVMRRGEVVGTVDTSETSIAALTGLMVGGASAAESLAAGGAPAPSSLAAGGAPAPSSLTAGGAGAASPSGWASAARPAGGASTSRSAGGGQGRVLADRLGAMARGTAGRGAALRVSGLRVRGAQGTEVVRDVGFEVFPGEIVGIAGVQGNGQTELIEAIAGLLPYQGQVWLDGESVDGLSPGDRLASGLAHIPEDRHRRGLVLEFPVADNFILGAQAAYARAGFMERSAIAHDAQRAVDRFGVYPPDIALPAAALSGGNQQKVVVARELGRLPKALLAAQPTRGVDIGAMATVHEALRVARTAGCGILLVSADLAELLALSDRILVMYRGELVGDLPRIAASEAVVGALMVGGTAEG